MPAYNPQVEVWTIEYQPKLRKFLIEPKQPRGRDENIEKIKTALSGLVEEGTISAITVKDRIGKHMIEFSIVPHDDPKVLQTRAQTVVRLLIAHDLMGGGEKYHPYLAHDFLFKTLFKGVAEFPDAPPSSPPSRLAR